MVAVPFGLDAKSISPNMESGSSAHTKISHGRLISGIIIYIKQVSWDTMIPKDNPSTYTPWFAMFLIMM